MLDKDFEYTKYVDNLCSRLFFMKGFNKAKLLKYVSASYYNGGTIHGYIEFTNEKELRKNKFFKMIYSKLSKKYKQLIDVYIASFLYRDKLSNQVQHFTS